MSKDDSALLVSNELVGSGQPIQEVIHCGQLALVRLEQNRTWQDWCAVISALAEGRKVCAAVSGGQTAGKHYNASMGRWLRCYGFDRIDKSDRSRLLRCADHLKTIDTWRSGRPLSEQLELNHPRIVYERWQRTLERDEEYPNSCHQRESKEAIGLYRRGVDRRAKDRPWVRAISAGHAERMARANGVAGRQSDHRPRKAAVPEQTTQESQAADRPQRGTGSSALNEVSTRSRSRSDTRRAPPRCLNRASGPPPEGRCGGRLGRNGRRDRCSQHRSRH